MASITQTIPNYFGGISQVPDSQKGQGQVNEALNVIPEINRGLMKRPGSARISPTNESLVGATHTGIWFHYYRDEDEGSYIGQVQINGTVNIWDAETGAAQNVTQGSSSVQSYLATVNTDTTIRGNEDLQFKLLLTQLLFAIEIRLLPGILHKRHLIIPELTRHLQRSSVLKMVGNMVLMSTIPPIPLIQQ